MRHPVHLAALALLVVALAACSTAPATSPSPVPTTVPSVTPTMVPATPSPAPTTAYVGPTFDPSMPPSLEYDFTGFPELPTPLLVAGKQTATVVGIGGCVTRYYEPADDPFGRAAQSGAECVAQELAAGPVLAVAPNEVMSVRAPEGYLLGAQLTVSDGQTYENYAIVAVVPNASRTTTATDVSTWPQIAREQGYALDEITFFAPSKPGDYVIAVAAALGRVDRLYREVGTNFFYRVRVGE